MAFKYIYETILQKVKNLHNLKVVFQKKESHQQAHKQWRSNESTAREQPLGGAKTPSLRRKDMTFTA